MRRQAVRPRRCVVPGFSIRCQQDGVGRDTHNYGDPRHTGALCIGGGQNKGLGSIQCYFKGAHPFGRYVTHVTHTIKIKRPKFAHLPCQRYRASGVLAAGRGRERLDDTWIRDGMAVELNLHLPGRQHPAKNV